MEAMLTAARDVLHGLRFSFADNRIRPAAATALLFRRTMPL
jgi:hypothetical protein